METGQPAPVQPGKGEPWEYSLRKYLLLLATLVASVTYTAGVNPPGGVWQKGFNDDGQFTGDHIIHYQYLAFFYCNATSFAASLVVIVLILILAIQQDKKKEKGAVWVVALRLVMVLDMLSLVGAYSAGTCRDKVSIVYSTVLLVAIFIYIVVLKFLDRWFPHNDSGSGDVMPTPNPSPGSASSARPVPVCDSAAMPKVEEKQALKKLKKAQERLCKVLMLLATFSVSITYVAGLSTPGGFWDNIEELHRPGDPILKEPHKLRLMVFLLCNTTSFMASLLTTMLLIVDGKKLREKRARSLVLYGCIVVVLVGLVGAYAAGSCRKTDTTVCVVGLVGAVLAYILLHASCISAPKSSSSCTSPTQQTDEHTDDNVSPDQQPGENQQTGDNASAREALDKARSLVLLLATLAATITYSAGLDPPGGLWQDNRNEHMAGNPILLTTNASRYNVFFYCNSVSFVASLVVVILVQKEHLVKHHVLEAAMILDLFGLIGAYAAGSCRKFNHSIYAMALAGAVLVYVVIHVIFFTLDHKEKIDESQDRLLEKRRKRLLLFAIFTATITYQAGLTPPGGFLLQGDNAGNPVLLYNNPRRYKYFFYCNSVSFMLSIALMILLVNPIVYKPAIRSNALSVCTAVGLFCLMGAYAAGSTQDIKTSIYILVLVVLVLFVTAGLLLLVVLVGKGNRNSEQNEEERNKKEEMKEEDELKVEEERKKAHAWSKCPMLIRIFVKNLKNINYNSVHAQSREQKEEEEERKKHTRRKYLMLLGILGASVAYQAGLKPPGGTWESSGNGHEAGNPMMHDNMRGQYLVFFYSNSISFVASIAVIIMLLPHWLPKEKKEKCEEWSLKVMNMVIVLDLVALLGAYAAGSSRGWRTSMYVVALIVAVLGYFAIHINVLSLRSNYRRLCREMVSSRGLSEWWSGIRRYAMQSSQGNNSV